MTTQQNNMSDLLTELFQRACQLNGDARAEYLEATCSGHVKLRAEIESLLAAHDAQGEFLANPTGEHVHTHVHSAAKQVLHETPGTVIGKYKLLQLIGEGGFGVVYMAEQKEPVKRKVALKIIKLGMDTRQVIARFEAERQALAMMDHPNIARVLDGGATDTGRPYFVMELVKGISITEYCDKNNLSATERLELFMQVCNAVQHAHQKGIIHRDIKPTNILVTLHDGVPVPKVIDFGIAKATNAELTAKTLFTEFRQLIGTPEYMSPEQAEMSGLDIDTRTDIYSLGVLLYELLTGTTPLDAKTLREAGYAEMQRIIREQEPPKPSTRVSSLGERLPEVARHRQIEPQGLSRLIRGDLDWIVMKSLEKDRTRRYETANGLAMDVRRYLNNEPVLATPPNPLYRFRKFARRNRVAVLAASMVFLALFAGMVGTGWGMIEARQQRDAAEVAAEAEKMAKETAETRDAETKLVLDFVENQILAAARPEGQEGGLGRDVMLRQAIEAALPRIGENFPDQPLIEARLCMTIGESFWYLGEAKKAEAQFLRARELYTARLGPDHPDTLEVRQNLGVMYIGLGRYAEAAKLYEELLPLRNATLGPEHPDTLGSMNALGASYIQLGRYAEAEELFEELLPLLGATFDPEHLETLDCMMTIGYMYTLSGRLEEALKLQEEVFQGLKAEFGPDHPYTLASMMGFGYVYTLFGRYVEAQEVLEETFERNKAQLGPDHPQTLVSMCMLGSDYQLLGRYEEALKLNEETLRLMNAKLGREHLSTLHVTHHAALTYYRLGRYEEAFKLLEETKRLQNDTLGPDHFVTLRLRLDLALIQCRTGQTENGIAEAKSVSEAKSAIYEHIFTAGWVYAVAADETPNAEESERYAAKAVELMRRAVEMGWRDATWMKTDPDLDALRARDDFKKLLAELEEKNSLER